MIGGDEKGQGVCCGRVGDCVGWLLVLIGGKAMVKVNVWNMGLGVAMVWQGEGESW